MGDLADDFQIMKEEREKRRDELEPTRLKFAADALVGAGYFVTWEQNERRLNVWSTFGGKELCHIYPYTGWWSGKGIGSSRGIKELVKKLMESGK